MEIGNKIKELRIQKGLTQEELAEKTGLSTRTIQRIENGEVDPRIYTLSSIAEALDIAYEELIKEEVKAEINKNEQVKWLALFHLSGIFTLLLPPIAFFIWKRDAVKDLNKHAVDILNFQISIWIYMFAAAILVLIVIGLPILIFLSLYSTVIVIINTLKVLNKEPYRYPFSLKILKKLD
jgi:transcriptional regulator with XRE-family HTH domain